MFNLKLFLEKRLIKKYTKIGKELGDALSYSYMGPISGFNKLLSQFNQMQDQVIKKGYIPYPIEQLIDAGGYGMALSELSRDNQNKALTVKTRNNLLILEAQRIQNSPGSIISRLYK